MKPKLPLFIVSGRKGGRMLEEMEFGWTRNVKSTVKRGISQAVIIVATALVTAVSLTYLLQPHAIQQAAIDIPTHPEPRDEVSNMGTEVSSEDPIVPSAIHTGPVTEVKEDLNPGYPPCGDVCSYAVDKKNSFPGHYYPLLMKNVNCDNIMARMAFKDHHIEYPPPKSPPEHLYEEFTQNGQCRIRNQRYFVQFDLEEKPLPLHFTQEVVEKYQLKDKEGKHANIYNDGNVMSEMIRDYKQWVKGHQGFVIGTRTPWLEGILLNNDVSHVSSLEYGKLIIDHPRINTFDPYSFAESYLRGEVELFDFGVTFSSLEHSGLGRYGDPLNPYGDFEAMAQAWCVMKPGGLFILGLPGAGNDTCYIEWNAHRKYSAVRLQHLTANWNILEIRQCPTDPHIVIAMSKPYHPIPIN